MFDFSVAVQLFQGSAQRTWNCFTEFTNLVWYKFNHIRHPIMPRSRRRHHSRSRSRSRSHSHDRDRDVKRRKIDSIESPTHKRSVSCEEMNIPDNCEQNEDYQKKTEEFDEENPDNTDNKEDDDDHNNKEINNSTCSIISSETDRKSINQNTTPRTKKALEERERERNERKLQKENEREKLRQEKERQKQEKLEQKRKEREEKEEQKRKEREEREEQKRKEREEKEEQKRKEKEEKEELKRKEREEKEQKRKEREEREMQKRKEREQEKLRKQQEIEEKNKEKQKQEEQKQKAAAAFVNFFVPKKTEIEDKKLDNSTTSIFMPFEIKSDMRLPPKRRSHLTQEEQENLDKFLKSFDVNSSYLLDLKNGKTIGKSSKTWPYEDSSDDIYIIEDDLGESICEDKRKYKNLRVKFLKFHENRRPPYYGTWRKKSVSIKPRKPFVEDKEYFDYEIDSDEEWEEEEQGESLNGSDNEDKENDNENEDDYEVDNEFFVPHGHLSDDEIDDEVNSKLSPTALKEKLKLLKDEFEQDMKTQTQKIKPRSIGCVWYNKNGDNVIETIDRYLSPLAILTNGQIIVKKRQIQVVKTPKKVNKEMKEEIIPIFLKFIDQNPNKKKKLIDDFLSHLQTNGSIDDIPKNIIEKHLKMFAEWKKCADKGPLFNKYIWCVFDDVKEKYGLIESN